MAERKNSHIVSSYGASGGAPVQYNQPSQNNDRKQQTDQDPVVQQVQPEKVRQEDSTSTSGNRTLIFIIAGVIIAALVILVAYRFITTIPTTVQVSQEETATEETLDSEDETSTFGGLDAR